jgi:hypothetical protein
MRDVRQIPSAAPTWPEVWKRAPPTDCSSLLVRGWSGRYQETLTGRPGLISGCCPDRMRYLSARLQRLGQGETHKSIPQGIISWAGNSIAQNVSPSGHRAYKIEQHLLSAKSSCVDIRSEARADPKEVRCPNSWSEEHDCRLIHQSNAFI